MTEPMSRSGREISRRLWIRRTDEILPHEVVVNQHAEFARVEAWSVEIPCCLTGARATDEMPW